MTDFISTIFSFSIVLGLIVLIHEMGHYMAARLMGVKVETFSIGFGRRIVGTKLGDTDFRISLIPLGGYVKMSGEEAEDDKSYNSWDFQAKNRAQKIFILASGALMNILLAVVIFVGIYMSGVKVNEYSLQEPVLGYVQKDSAADKAGLKAGDLIKNIDGSRIKDWKELELVIATNADEILKIDYERNGIAGHADLTVDADSKYHIGFAGIFYPMEAVIGGVLKDGAAEKYGIKAGDRILSVDGVVIDGYFPLRDILAASPDKKMVFTIERDGIKKDVEVVTGNRENRGFLGIMPHYPVAERSYGFTEAVKKSCNEMVKLAGLTFTSFKKMLIGKLSPKTLSGPIEIARFSNKAMKSGMISFFTLIAFISLQLGIVNLFPVPALDGGHLMIYTIEAIIRKEFSVRVKTVLINAGFLILLTLMGFVILNDVAKALPNGWGSFWPF